MRLIDKHVTQIVAGYDEILKAETDLRNRWRPKLIAAYAQRILHLEGGNSLNRYNLPLLAAISGMVLMLIGSGLSCVRFGSDNPKALLFCCGGPLLALLGLLLLGAAGFSYFNGNKQKSRRVPLHPYRDGIFPDLRKSWIHGLSGSLKAEIPDYPGYYGAGEKDHGAEGERLFVRRLLEILDGNYFVLVRSMQRRGEDVDVIVVGPKGVWVFETKHWSGEIYWDNQGWRRVQTYFERGGVEVTKEGEVGEPPDQQWTRAAAEVARTLQMRVPQVLQHHPVLAKVRGGIVFTKPEATLKIQSERPVFWGPLNFWIKILQEIDPKAKLDTRSTLQVIEALLVRHQELSSEGGNRSMVMYARGVVQDTEKKLTEWVEG